MNLMLKKWSILICICIAFCLNHANAQNGNSRDDLQKQAQTLQKELDDLIFAFRVCKFVKSNAIVIAKNNKTLGIGAGQTNRLASSKIACQNATEFFKDEIKGSVAASDAFFPFADGLNELIKIGVKCIIQPGGSIKDEEVIAAAEKAGIAMVFTGIRNFRH